MKPVIIPALDKIRGLAALSVLLVHWYGWAPAGSIAVLSWLEKEAMAVFISFFWAGGLGTHPGVIVFIVLSGFCIHLPLSGTGRTPGHGYWQNYFWRRYVRIVPVYWFGLLLGMASFLVVRPVPAFSMSDVVLRFSMVGHFFPRTSFLGNDPLSTVAAEFWLYTIYPILLLLRGRLGLWSWAVLGATGYVLVLYFRAAGVAASWADTSIFHFLPYWLLGAVAAELHSGRNWDRPGLLWPGVILFSLAYILLGHIMQFHGGHYIATPFLGVACAILLIAVSAPQPASADRESAWGRILIFGGLISYTVYVIHTPLLLAWGAENPQTVLGMTLSRYGALVAVIVMAIISYYAVEKPFHRLARRPPAIFGKAGRPLSETSHLA